MSIKKQKFLRDSGIAFLLMRQIGGAVQGAEILKQTVFCQHSYKSQTSLLWKKEISCPNSLYHLDKYPST